ncbi:RE1-silencing transcription factor A isoform X2 [Bicyclus anynana]|uniref:RE1-silencing transcription factor A isoform X2 n=1 Tax=Bicyclus anynana TaxID=110368 RepID=A0ABM3M357_BICAN|nr:RE1-silencing transcription factor A isoform X2 [Bicyclus anynana]
MLPTFLLLNRMINRRRNMRKIKKPVKNDKSKLNTDCCRTCLATEELVDIFYDQECDEKRSEDLRLVTGLEIKLNDGLSQKICNRCIESMESALQFRHSSRRAYKSLLASLGSKSKKKFRSKPNKSIKRIKNEKLEVDIDVYDDDVYAQTDDFQNDTGYTYDEHEDSVPVKLEQEAEPQARRKRDTIPNALSYKCNTCSKEFRMKTTYKAHLRFHTNYCVCETCGKRCRNNNQLQEHKRARHGLGRIHKCAYCEYSSATKEALTIHERRHTGERPYICDHCGATFHRRSNLVQHIAIHLPEKNFQCPICFKREKSRKLVQVHTHKYHAQRQYRYWCPVCRDSFARPSNARRHLARAHHVPRERQGRIERFEFDKDEAEMVPLGDILDRVSDMLGYSKPDAPGDWIVVDSIGESYTSSAKKRKPDNPTEESLVIDKYKKKLESSAGKKENSGVKQRNLAIARYYEKKTEKIELEIKLLKAQLNKQCACNNTCEYKINNNDNNTTDIIDRIKKLDSKIISDRLFFKCDRSNDNGKNEINKHDRSNDNGDNRVNKRYRSNDNGDNRVNKRRRSNDSGENKVNKHDTSNDNGDNRVNKRYRSNGSGENKVNKHDTSNDSGDNRVNKRCRSNDSGQNKVNKNYGSNDSGLNKVNKNYGSNDSGENNVNKNYRSNDSGENSDDSDSNTWNHQCKSVSRSESKDNILCIDIVKCEVESP